jgi:hypothetical protein
MTVLSIDEKLHSQIVSQIVRMALPHEVFPQGASRWIVIGGWRRSTAALGDAAFCET